MSERGIFQRNNPEAPQKYNQTTALRTRLRRVVSGYMAIEGARHQDSADLSAIPNIHYLLGPAVIAAAIAIGSTLASREVSQHSKDAIPHATSSSTPPIRYPNVRR